MRPFINKERVAMKACHILLLALLGTGGSISGAVAAGGVEAFGSPEQAVHALVAAAHDNDAAALLKIFGPTGRGLISSGDKVADRQARSHFYALYRVNSKISEDSADKATLIIGAEDWPFPIPMVRDGKAWRFDTGAGAQEIIDRRIGRNELNAIDVCRSYVRAQRDYAADAESGQQSQAYARKFISSSGRHDGLYWPVQPGEKESPIGPEMAAARAEGYRPHARNPQPPYHGYYYKILTRQGAAAPGGARDYVVAGRMTGGFALLAFPAKYGDSGVMTFVVNQDGIVYAKNLGPMTETAAPTITEFNPDPSWKTR
jgi:hypothetical protein